MTRSIEMDRRGTYMPSRPTYPGGAVRAAAWTGGRCLDWNLIGTVRQVQAVQPFLILIGDIRNKAAGAPPAPWPCTAPGPANRNDPGLPDWLDSPYEKRSPGGYCSPAYLGLAPAVSPLSSALPCARPGTKKGRRMGARGMSGTGLHNAQPAVAELVRFQEFNLAHFVPEHLERIPHLRVYRCNVESVPSVVHRCHEVSRALADGFQVSDPCSHGFRCTLGFHVVPFAGCLPDGERTLRRHFLRFSHRVGDSEISAESVIDSTGEIYFRRDSLISNQSVLLPELSGMTMACAVFGADFVQRPLDLATDRQRKRRSARRPQRHTTGARHGHHGAQERPGCDGNPSLARAAAGVAAGGRRRWHADDMAAAVPGHPLPRLPARSGAAGGSDSIVFAWRFGRLSARGAHPRRGVGRFGRGREYGGQSQARRKRNKKFTGYKNFAV